MPNFPIIHPPEKPAWLQDWLSPQDFRARFTRGVINAACDFLLKPGTAPILHWLPDGFRAQIGTACATWRCRAGSWQTSCSCNYPDQHCLHAYGAGFLLNEVCRRKNWSLAGEAAGKPPLQQVPSAPEPTLRQGFLPNLFSEQPAGQPRTARKCILEVEADLQHQAGRVGIRFYCRENDLRRLLKLGTVLGYIRDLSDPQRCDFRCWPEQDRLFMRFVLPFIKQGFPRNNDFTMLNIAAEEFQAWRKKWQVAPERFLNRATQEVILPPGLGTPVRQHVELKEDGDFIIVTVLFTFPNGEQRQPRQIFRSLGNDPNCPINRRELLQFRPPIPWPVLSRNFERGPQRIPRRQAGPRLRELLAGRLDLIAAGPCVIRHEQQSERAELFISQRPGAFLLSCLVDGKPVPVNETPAPKSSISEQEGKFLVHIYDCAALCRPIQQALTEFVQSRRGSLEGHQAVIPDNRQNALALQDFWQSLPPGLNKNCLPTLSSLLKQQPEELSATFHGRERQNFVEVSCTLQAAGQTFTAADLKSALAGGGRLLRSQSGWLSLDPEKAQQILAQLESAGYDDHPRLLLRREAGQRLTQLTRQDGFAVDDATRSYLDCLRREPIPDIPPLPPELTGILRPYQATGYTFLADRCLNGAGCILADDMGLGKTLQVLALLSVWKQREGKDFSALVICPASVMHVWSAQAAKFCPSLSVLVWAGGREERRQAFTEASCDLLVTHYGMARIEAELLRRRRFTFVILDEAQAIKNPDALVTRAVKSLSCRHRIAITGTPLENKLLDLWSIMDFLNPKLLGPKESYLVPDCISPSELRSRLSLLLLRRSKKLVAPELPPRIVEVLPVELEDAQRDFYNRTLVETRQRIKAGGAMEILSGLTRLRQVCCDPELFLKRPHDYGSAKLALLLEKLSEVLDNGHSVLVFSQFTQMLAIIARELTALGLPFRSITGETPLAQRSTIVEEFSADDQPGILLLSLKAAGTGLTLTKADYVFLCDPWWNPAVENQAIDRTHRLGQDKTVLTYRMVVRDSIEERVLRLIQEKQELFNAVMGEDSDEAVSSRLTREDLLSLLQ